MNVTPTRLAWLQHLAEARHWVEWRRMPTKKSAAGSWRRRDGRGLAVDNKTWRPMVEAGLILYEARPGRFIGGASRAFHITAKGLQLLGLGDGCDKWFACRK